MKAQAQVVVIGGGVVGASVLYHLTKAGCTDVVLLERSELSAGSTWHSAGGMHTLNGDPNVAKLQQYTIGLYRELERESGIDASMHLTGGVMLADTPERLDWLKMIQARSRYLGIQTELISISEAKEMMPLIDERYFVGAMWDANEGHLDPSQITNAYATCARRRGAEVYRNSWVRAIDRSADGGWNLTVYDTVSNADKAIVYCEHVVNAGGLWAREVGRMVGLELPVLAMEHMYLLTDEIPEVVEYNRRSGKELIHAIDFKGEIYTRQEGNGMLLGTYERRCRPWSPTETPWDFDKRLLTPDLDRIAESLETGFRHFPALATAGIKTVVNGPFTFAPDGNPLLGPVRGLRGYWSACAVMAGLSQGGGVGLSLANWIIEGDPGHDVWGMDIARFGDYATMSYTDAKVRENYSRRFRITFPNEFLPRARNVGTSPIHDRLVACNAVFGDNFGLESALWFQTTGEEPVEDVIFGRSNAWPKVREETLAVRSSVGMIETTGFSKFRFAGSGARAFLDRILAGRVPIAGRMALTPMTNEAGNLIGDLTVGALGAARGEPAGLASTVTGGATANTRHDTEYIVFGSGVAERYYERWFDLHMPEDGSVRYQTLGWEMCGLSIAGPNARAMLEKVTDADVSPAGMRFMAFTEINIGFAPVVCGRITFTGDLGYEFWMPARYQRYIFDVLCDAGREFDLRLFGLHTLNSLRLEKGFGSWAREYRPIYDPFEAGVGRFVRMDSDFVGRDALAAKYGDDGPGSSLRLVTFTVESAGGRGGFDAVGDEPIWLNDSVVGWVTSGGYAHHSERSVAMGYIPAALVGSAGRFEVEILGERKHAEMVDGCLWDTAGERMRG